MIPYQLSEQYPLVFTLYDECAMPVYTCGYNFMPTVEIGLGDFEDIDAYGATHLDVRM